jgi:hypothetical protein
MKFTFCSRDLFQNRWAFLKKRHFDPEKRNTFEAWYYFDRGAETGAVRPATLQRLV